MQLSEIINYAIYGFIAFFVLVNVIRGLAGGVRRQVLRLITVAASATVAFLVCIKIYPTVYGFIAGKSMEELIALISSALARFGIAMPEAVPKYLSCLESETAAYVLAVPMLLLIVPVVFIVCFFVLSLITKLIHVIVCGMLGFTKRNNNFITRILGGAVGLVQGVLIAAVILLPIVGTYSSIGYIVKTAEEKHPDSQNSQVVANAYNTYLAPAEENIAVKLLSEKCGFLYEKFITVDVDDEKIKLSDVGSDLFNVFVLYGDLGGVDFSNLTEANKATINEMVDSIGNDKYITSILSGFFRALPRTIDKGLVKITFEEPLKGFVSSFFHAFETSDKDNVKTDLSMVVNIAFIVSDSGILKAEGGEGMMNALLSTDASGATTMKRITGELSKNSRFAVISEQLTELAVHALLANSGIEGDAAETVTEITDTLNEIIAIDKESYATEEEYRAEVSSKIDETLRAEGIPLDEEQLEMVTDFVATELEGKEELTEADLAEFIAEYYNAYASGEMPVA